MLGRIILEGFSRRDTVRWYGVWVLLDLHMRPPELERGLPRWVCLFFSFLHDTTFPYPVLFLFLCLSLLFYLYGYIHVCRRRCLADPRGFFDTMACIFEVGGGEGCGYGMVILNSLRSQTMFTGERNKL